MFPLSRAKIKQSWQQENITAADIDKESNFTLLFFLRYIWLYI